MSAYTDLEARFRRFGAVEEAIALAAKRFGQEAGRLIAVRRG